MNPYARRLEAQSLVHRLCDLKPSAGSTVLVAIDGCGGSGKSTLAAYLTGEIPNAVIVHTDDFASWDNPIDWWPRLREQVLEPLARDETARYQRYDWGERRLMEWHEVVAPVVILEGVSSTRREFLPYLAFTIFVTCPREVRLRRGLERDGDGALPLWEQWMAAENAYLEEHRPMERAHVVISGN